MNNQSFISIIFTAVLVTSTMKKMAFAWAAWMIESASTTDRFAAGHSRKQGTINHRKYQD